MKRFSIKTILEITGVVIAIVTGILYLIGFVKDQQVKNVDGAWTFTFNVKESSLSSYKNLSAGYKIYITQEGKKVKGKGEKFWVNGVELPSQQHDPLTFEGIIEDGILKAQYELFGAKRTSFGKFAIEFIEDSACMQGSFCGSAANTKGDVFATRD